MKRLILLPVLLALAFVTASAQGGKSVSVLGDSYSTFEGYVTPQTNLLWYFERTEDKTDVCRVEQTWWHRLISRHGLRLCVNNSYSGATICNSGYDDNDYSDRSFCTRLTQLGCPDIILVFGGTNDSWAHSPIGDYKYDGWKRADLYTFRPAMAYMLDHLKKHYPNVQLAFILNTELSAEITASCKEICKHYGVQCITLENIDKKSGHPSVKGMQQIEQQVAKALGLK